MQYIEGLSDRQAAEAVRSRIDWKYALGLELTDSGFDFSVLSEFRQRLITGEVESQLLDLLLAHFQERGWLKERGQQRTDSTHVLGAIRTLNRLESNGETLRAALNDIAIVAPDWLRAWTPPQWFERYERAMEEYRLPKGIPARTALAETIGNDGMQLLIAVWESPALSYLRHLPSMEILRTTWVHQYYVENDRVRLREAHDLPPAGKRMDSPYDPDARYGNKRSITWTGDHIVDAGYVDATLLVTSQKQYDVAVVGPVRPNSSWQSKISGGYDISQFKVNWNTKRVTCPMGKKSTKNWTTYRDKWDNPAIRVGFPRKTCQLCPNRSLCTQSVSEPRRLTLGLYNDSRILLSHLPSNPYPD